MSTIKSEAAANQALQPLAPADRLASTGWKVGANALQPVKPRACVAPVQSVGMLARIVSFLSAR